MGELHPSGQRPYCRLVERNPVPQRQVCENTTVEVADVVDDEALLENGMAGPQAADALVLTLLTERTQLVVPGADLTVWQSSQLRFRVPG